MNTLLICEGGIYKWNEGTEHGLAKDIWYEMNVWLWHHYARHMNFSNTVYVKRKEDYFTMQTYIENCKKHIENTIFHCVIYINIKQFANARDNWRRQRCSPPKKDFAGKKPMNKNSSICMTRRVYIYNDYECIYVRLYIFQYEISWRFLNYIFL